jgi:integrase
MVNSPRYPRPPLTREQAERVWRDLTDTAMTDRARAETVRLAAALTLTRATGARAGELATLSRHDLQPVAGRVRICHRPQGTRYGNGTWHTHDLDDNALIVVRRWLTARRRLTSGLEGGDPAAFFVTTMAATARDGSYYAAGMPLHVDGLKTSWMRYAARINRTAPPLLIPSRFEQLRRAWHPSPSYGVKVNVPR